jgi:predicted acyltransferase
MASSLPTDRLMSLDAYRGFVMLAMASEGLGLTAVSERMSDGRVWRFLGYQADHVTWTGCAAWDLIQPSFLFMVGVAMPYSYASRLARGESSLKRGAHVLYRAAILVVLGVFLYSTGRPETNYTFVNTLAQIGLAYALVYPLVGQGWRIQLAVSAAILAAYWLLFALYPAPGPDFDWQAVGVEGDVERLTGLFAHWNKNANFAHAFDVWFLNLFPRSEPFRFNGGGYQTLNFVPSIATMIFGLMAGELMRGPRSRAEKFWRLAAAGVAGLAIGWLLGQTVCPIVKRIWTPSWTIFSTGWTCLLLAGFFWVIDIVGWRGWAWPLTIVGMNSIAIYLLAEKARPWIAMNLQTHLGQRVFEGQWFGRQVFDPVYEPIAHAALVLLVLWLACLWLYRQRIFVRI